MLILIIILILLIISEICMIISLFSMVKCEREYSEELENEIEDLLRELESLQKRSQGGGGSKS